VPSAKLEGWRSHVCLRDACPPSLQLQLGKAVAWQREEGTAHTVACGRNGCRKITGFFYTTILTTNSTASARMFYLEAGTEARGSPRRCYHSTERRMTHIPFVSMLPRHGLTNGRSNWQYPSGGMSWMASWIWKERVKAQTRNLPLECRLSLKVTDPQGTKG
jgi:hypothetical protein